MKTSLTIVLFSVLTMGSFSAFAQDTSATPSTTTPPTKMDCGCKDKKGKEKMECWKACHKAHHHHGAGAPAAGGTTTPATGTGN